MKKLWLIILGLFVFWFLFIGNVSLAEETTEWSSSASNAWINMKDGCLTWMWTNCFNYEQIIFWENQPSKRSATTLVQDVVLWATFMVWTVLTVVIMYSWLMYIFAARSGKDPKEYQKWLINAAIWAVLVRWAYAIVRLIQYIAKW